jgi:hypothetical protein
MSSAAFTRLLEAGDVDALRGAWAKIAPHLPQPETREKAEIVMHMARTSLKTLPLRRRAWSHRWLAERDLPSQLPDELRPRAERMYPIVAEGVGISVNTKNPLLQPLVGHVRKSMEDAVSECYADKRTDPVFVTARMTEARERTYETLLGIKVR